ncbi:hypothetical protein QAD02_013890 [Eretmocerus hayati]|uniref:Uncharacterized protein n=1 Tax=Eretmocerus hayati TaxID=131215 RepID=A0ACC2P4R2_9HYME|nr:hypothetical protein QAD02_013890 [Eretmocerus hayati]
MTFCIFQLCDVENEPPWDDPLVIVPIQFMVTKIKAEEAGASFILYPSMSHSLDVKAMIKDFVDRQATPPESWGAKKCVLKNVAATYQLASELFATAKAMKPKFQKKRKVNQNMNGSKVLPISNEAKKLSARDAVGDVPQQSCASSVVVTSEQQSNEEEVEHQNDCVIPDSEVTRILFEMPPELASFQSSTPAATVSSSPQPAQPMWGDSHTPEPNSSDTGNTLSDLSLEGIKTPSEINSYIILSKKEYFDMEKRINAKIESTVSKAVTKVVDDKMKPRLDKFDLDMIEVKAIARHKPENQDILTSEGFKELYDFNLALTTYNDFLEFNAAIQGKNLEDEEETKYKNVASDLKKHIKTMCNCSVDPEDNCKAVMRRFLKNELIVLFTAKKPSGSKPIFKNTAFFTCMLDVMLQVPSINGKYALDDGILASHIATLINITKTSLKRGSSGTDQNVAVE